MKKAITYVGLDVHKTTISLCAYFAGLDEPLPWELANDERAARRIVRWLQRRKAGEAKLCYEAGSCGFVLQRALRQLGLDCVVIAPSLIPTRSGDKVKTDRRDARKLARELRSDNLTEVHPPEPGDESVRDLCRCRDDARRDLRIAKQRLSQFLLRRGLHYRQGNAWTLGHMKWLRSLSLEDHDQVTFDAYMATVRRRAQHLSELTKAVEEVAQTERYAESVGHLRCLRGVDTVTAVSVLAEIHDFRRFPSARHLMSYLGLIPSQYSSGKRVVHGAITKAGNSHVRRLLILAAWHDRHQPRVGANLRRRRRGQPPEVVELAEKAQRRLSARYRKLTTVSNLPSAKAVTAIARELAGFIWALASGHDKLEVAA